MIFRVTNIQTFFSMLKVSSYMPYVYAGLIKRRIDNQKSTNLPVISRCIIVLSAVNAAGSNLLRMEHVIPVTIETRTDEINKYYWNMISACQDIALQNSDLARFGNDEVWIHGVLPLTQLMDDELVGTPNKSNGGVG